MVVEDFLFARNSLFDDYKNHLKCLIDSCFKINLPTSLLRIDRNHHQLFCHSRPLFDCLNESRKCDRNPGNDEESELRHGKSQVTSSSIIASKSLVQFLEALNNLVIFCQLITFIIIVLEWFNVLTSIHGTWSSYFHVSFCVFCWTRHGIHFPSAMPNSSESLSQHLNPSFFWNPSESPERHFHISLAGVCKFLVEAVELLWDLWCERLSSFHRGQRATNFSIFWSRVKTLEFIQKTWIKRLQSLFPYQKWWRWCHFFFRHSFESHFSFLRTRSNFKLFFIECKRHFYIQHAHTTVIYPSSRGFGCECQSDASCHCWKHTKVAGIAALSWKLSRALYFRNKRACFYCRFDCSRIGTPSRFWLFGVGTFNAQPKRRLLDVHLRQNMRVNSIQTHGFI